jgi:cell division protein ZipA
MDISVRDWMIIIGVLLIVAVLLDGYRRMRGDPNRVRVSLTPVAGEDEDGDDDVLMRGELPNGGARVIGRDDEDVGPGEELATPEAAAKLDEPPLLTDAAPEDGDERREPASGENLDLLDGIVPGSEDDSEPTAAVDSVVLLLHVVARDEAGLAGDDILQVLLAYEMRFGEMNFFHRHEEAAGRGRVLFSVANMRQPGVFDIDAMAEFTTSGLIFFLTLPGPEDMMGAFELMLETAQGVAENLGGDLLDESRSVTTRQTLEHMRQQIRDLERKMLTQAKRQG